MSDKSPWIPVGELQEGFTPDANILQPTDALCGKSFVLYFSDGTEIAHTFTSGDQLTWMIKNGAEEGQTATETYCATSLRDGIYFVDFIKHQERAMSVTLIMDLKQQVFTAVISQMPTKEEAGKSLIHRVADNDELTSVRAAFMHGTIDMPYTKAAPLHHETDELVGKRVFYQYSPHEKYEHIYLNQNMYSWHCVAGVEKGLADTDRCHFYKVAESLYLFVWREKIVPTVGVIMIDLERLKTTGKIMGYAEGDFSGLSNFQVGAYARPLNQTSYDE